MRTTWGGALADTFRGALSDQAIRVLETAPDYLCARIDDAVGKRGKLTDTPTARYLTDAPTERDDAVEIAEQIAEERETILVAAENIADERNAAIKMLEECRAALDRLRGVALVLAEDARDARAERDAARDRLADARDAWAAVGAEIDALRPFEMQDAAGICREALNAHEPDWSGATTPEERA